jgi:hypothetical protein
VIVNGLNNLSVLLLVLWSGISRLVERDLGLTDVHNWVSGIAWSRVLTLVVRRVVWMIVRVQVGVLTTIAVETPSFTLGVLASHG